MAVIMVMSDKKATTANITKFKNQLGTYLRLVKKGEEVIIYDRQTPVAKLVPYHEAASFKLETIAPKSAFTGFDKFYHPPQAATKIDSLSLLLEDRKKR